MLQVSLRPGLAIVEPVTPTAARDARTGHGVLQRQLNSSAPAPRRVTRRAYAAASMAGVEATTPTAARDARTGRALAEQQRVPLEGAGPRQQQRKEPQMKVEEMASKNHVNLVRLLGYCSHMDAAIGGIEQILIYEFMHNVDLEGWVGPGVAVPLNLRQRFDVLIGVAQGLQYLHSFGLVHRDIKPANILLDRNMQAKVADFGLVWISKGATVDATRVMGTPGYVDPAYSWTQKATPAADVYSFGVVVLSVVTARKGVVYLAGHTAVNSLEDNRMKLTDWVQPLVDAENADTIKDPRLDAPNHIILPLARFALSCTTTPVIARPTMARIVSELMAMKEECFGPETDPVLENVDRHVEDMRVSSLSQELRRASRTSEREGASGFSSTMGSVEENGGYR
ncbi:unnamed protein product [Closterium sp. Naga37s-1]|nr:unnamed protein product [Closterium sp. Naga37s-1]